MAQVIADRYIRSDGTTGPIGELVRTWARHGALRVEARTRHGLHRPGTAPPTVIVEASNDGWETAEAILEGVIDDVSVGTASPGRTTTAGSGGRAPRRRRAPTGGCASSCCDGVGSPDKEGGAAATPEMALASPR